MSNAFEAFAEAMAQQTQPSSSGPAASLDHVAILGGGADARLLAALCVVRNRRVTLFSAYGKELESLRAGSGITLRGQGPIGTIAMDRDTGPCVETTGALDGAVADADLIILTGPIHKQRTYAMVLADHLRDGQTLLVPNARTFGALETAWYLRTGGCRASVRIAEMHGLPHWIAEAGSVLTLSSARSCHVAMLPSGDAGMMQALQALFPEIQPCPNVISSSFVDGAGQVEIPALLMGGPAVSDGAPAIPMGGTPLPANATFASLIGDEHRAVMTQLAEERRAVAAQYGVRDLPDCVAWQAVHTGDLRGEGARPIPDAQAAKALIRDGVLASLMPLISAAECAGQAVPLTQSMVTLAGAMLGSDLAGAGRSLVQTGVRAQGREDARRQLDALAKGQM